jgi:hypothetical protein
MPGQPDRTLVPTRRTEFRVRHEPGILLRFVLPTTGTAPATEVLTIEPEGVFRDRRREEAP